MPEIVAICGAKNSGKTTLIEKLVVQFSKMGLKTAVIKHDAHLFEPDREGTDTSRFYASGAVGTAVIDDEKFQIVHRGKTDIERILRCFADADIILLEGFKKSNYKKIWLCSENDCWDVNNIAAWVGSTENKPRFDRDDIEAIADFIYKRSSKH